MAAQLTWVKTPRLWYTNIKVEWSSKGLLEGLTDRRKIVAGCREWFGLPCSSVKKTVKRDYIPSSHALTPSFLLTSPPSLQHSLLPALPQPSYNLPHPPSKISLSFSIILYLPFNSLFPLFSTDLQLTPPILQLFPSAFHIQFIPLIESSLPDVCCLPRLVQHPREVVGLSRLLSLLPWYSHCYILPSLPHIILYCCYLILIS